MCHITISKDFMFTNKTPVLSPTENALYASTYDARKFLDEALRMQEFNHPHILRLIGITLDKENLPLVVLPFMKHGDLLSYIRDETNVSQHTTRAHQHAVVGDLTRNDKAVHDIIGSCSRMARLRVLHAAAVLDS